MTENVYDKAADLIREHGWTSGANHDEDGYCLIGALRAADPQGALGAFRHRAMRPVQEVIDEQYADTVTWRSSSDGLPAVWIWNDNLRYADGGIYGVDDVLLVLDKAGRRFDEQVQS